MLYPWTPVVWVLDAPRKLGAALGSYAVESATASTPLGNPDHLAASSNRVEDVVNRPKNATIATAQDAGRQAGEALGTAGKVGVVVVTGAALGIGARKLLGV